VDLDEGSPARIIDGPVDVVETGARPRCAVAPTAEPMAAASGDPAELLDVDVEQLPRALPDVADGDTRGAIAITQPG
jgi:hypothetical protein